MRATPALLDVGAVPTESSYLLRRAKRLLCIETRSIPVCSTIVNYGRQNIRRNDLICNFITKRDAPQDNSERILDISSDIG